MSLILDGTQYVNVGNHAAFSFGAGEFSVLFRWKGLFGAGAVAPVSRAVYSGGWHGWHFEAEYAAGLSLSFYQASVHVDSPGGFTDPDHVYTIAGVRREGVAYVYIDGGASADLNSTSDVDSSYELHIGKNPDEVYPRPVTGRIDDVQIYSAGLTDSEIGAWAVNPADKARDSSDLILWYKFNEQPAGQVAAGAGSIIDWSGNGFHGTPVNGPVYGTGVYAPPSPPSGRLRLRRHHPIFMGAT